MNPIRLGVNIDHIATVRNARGGLDPSPMRAARAVLAAGADSITMHLREDRRHIREDDVLAVRAAITAPLNLEMAATDEMVRFALQVRPHACCLVPEKRTEVTTEGGLDVSGPFAADSMFTPPARAGYDVAMGMYHDQALIPLKTLDMRHGVNVTLGLPVVRTSPDHGTAFAIAGQGRADPSSLIAAIDLAAELAAQTEARP